MQYPNSLDNKHIDISLFFNVLNDNVYTDNRYNQLISLIQNSPTKYVYACYTESCYLKDNIYIPVFHTLYLASKFHNVVLNDPNDSWLVDAFPNNNYYIVSDNIKINKVKTIKTLDQIGEI